MTKLTLKNGETITGQQCGEGSVPCIIVGPGSFYLGKLSNRLKKSITFYAFDQEWHHSKNKPDYKNEHLDFVFFVNRTKLIIEAIKNQFGFEKIGLVDFSAYSVLACQVGIEMGHEHIAFILNAGAASSKIDPEFKDSDTFFKQNAEKERVIQYNQDNENFKKLQAGDMDAISLPDSNFIEMENTDKKSRRMTPTTYFGEFVRSLATKQVKNYQNPTIVEQLVQEWKYNLTGNVLSASTRSAYFNSLSCADPIKMQDQLVNMGLPVMSVYGKYDYTTPPPQENLVHQWGNKFYFFKVYSESGHYPSWEVADEFDSDVINFIKNYTQHSTNSKIISYS